MKRTYRGELNISVELMNVTYTVDDTSERTETLVSLGNKFCKRLDRSAREEDDGRLLPFNERVYVMRYDSDIIANGTTYLVRDTDGDWDITGVVSIGSRRKEMIELKCIKRG